MTRAEQLVARINAMPMEAIRDRLEWARCATNEEIIARQSVERHEWAERAAARIREA